MDLSDKYFSFWGILLAIIIFIIQPIAKKFDIKWLSYIKKNNRKITSSDIKKLEVHAFYSDIRKLKERGLRDVYLDSKKGTAQKLFVLIMFYFLTVLEKDTKDELRSIMQDSIKNKDQNLLRLEMITTKVEKNFRKHINEKLPTPIVNKYSYWIDKNLDWFQDSVSDTLSVQTDSYYEELDKYLYSCSLLMKILQVNLEAHIDTYNGEVDRLIADYDLSINNTLFSDIYFLS